MHDACCGGIKRSITKIRKVNKIIFDIRKVKLSEIIETLKILKARVDYIVMNIWI